MKTGKEILEAYNSQDSNLETFITLEEMIDTELTEVKRGQMQAPVKPEIAEAVKKAVQQDRREIIELLENYLLDATHCLEIEKLKFANKIGFADLILSIARGLIYGK